VPERSEPRELGPFWSGTITFGLVTVPVNLYPAHRSEQLGLRMLAPDGTPVARRYWCEKDRREVGDDHLVRGFEVAPGRHVIVTDDELDRLAPEKSRDIELTRFVDAGKLDPVMFDRPYVLIPGAKNPKAYRLLAKVMERTNRAGIATFVMNGKERIVAILAEKGILRAETLRFADEIRTPKEVGLPAKGKADRAGIAEFEKAIAARAKPGLLPEELRDPYAQKLKALVAKRRRSRGRVVARKDRAGEAGEPVDLLEVLKRSLKPASAASRKASRRAART
jgi:DNA end-binding protein Ku